MSDEEENGEGWQKVERRKSKKHKKAEAKLDVRFPPPSSSAASTMYVYHTPAQAAPPKFMYAKNEILRRRDAVGINVSACCLRFFFVCELFPHRTSGTSCCTLLQTHLLQAGSELR